MSVTWVWLAIAWVLCGLAVVAIVRAMFWDRARGRSRCPKCWYDMAQAEPVGEGDDRRWICPECGKSVHREKALRRTRRRWKWVPVTIILLAAACAAYLTPQANKSGWMSMAPTPGLIWWVGHFEPPEQYDSIKKEMSKPTPVAAELARRIVAGELSEPQLRWCIQELRIIQSRERWPDDREYLVTTSLPGWLETTWIFFGTSSPLAEDPKHYNSFHSSWAIGPIDPGMTEAPLDITLGRWSGRFQLPVKIVDSPEDALRAVRGPSVDDAVQRSLDLGIRPDNVNNLTGRNTMIGARLYRDRGGLADGIAIGIVVDLVRDGEIKMTWRARFHDSPFGKPVDWMRFNPPEPDWNESPDELERWRVRVRGDAGQCLTDFSRDKYWAGEYEVPLRSILQQTSVVP